MKRILVTNDDGVHSEGIKALAEAMKALGEVTVVAPLTEASAIGHALTLRRPLSSKRSPIACMPSMAPRPIASTSPSPACFAAMPDLVVSGINKGWNLGDDVTSSGTVSGAFEAALLGPPGIGVSLQRTGDRVRFFRGRARREDSRPVGARRKGFRRGHFSISTYRRANQGDQGDRPGSAEPRHQGRRARRSPRTAHFWIEEGQNEWEPHDRSNFRPFAMATFR